MEEEEDEGPLGRVPGVRRTETKVAESTGGPFSTDTGVTRGTTRSGGTSGGREAVPGRPLRPRPRGITPTVTKDRTPTPFSDVDSGHFSRPVTFRLSPIGFNVTPGVVGVGVSDSCVSGKKNVGYG